MDNHEVLCGTLIARSRLGSIIYDHVQLLMRQLQLRVHQAHHSDLTKKQGPYIMFLMLSDETEDENAQCRYLKHSIIRYAHAHTLALL